MPEAPDRRNPLRLIVSKETQLHILWLVGGGIFLSMAALAAAIFWVEDMVWVAALGLAAGLFVSLWVSRKIAGPFYRIERDLESILSSGAQGDPIQLRPGDPLQHLVELVNALIARSGPRSK
jgi:hypothetical protein